MGVMALISITLSLTIEVEIYKQWQNDPSNRLSKGIFAANYCCSIYCLSRPTYVQPSSPIEVQQHLSIIRVIQKWNFSTYVYTKVT